MIISFVFCKQKTAYEMRISDWSSDVCSSDLTPNANAASLQPKQDGTTRDSSKNCTGRIGLQSGAFLKNAGSSDFPLKTHEKPPPRALAEHQIQLLVHSFGAEFRRDPSRARNDPPRPDARRRLPPPLPLVRGAPPGTGAGPTVGDGQRADCARL